MASLRSIILDGRFKLYVGDGLRQNIPDLEEQKGLAEHSCQELKNRRTILVNAQKVYESMRQVITAKIGGDWDDLFYEIPRPKPPYQHMWIESLQDFGKDGVRRIGILIERAARSTFAPDWFDDLPDVRQHIESDQPTEIVTSYIWNEIDGDAACVGGVIYWTDEEGNLQYAFCNGNLGPLSDELRNYLCCQELWLLHTMARLNCHNVELRPAQGHGKVKPGKAHAPFSVWHEIVVKPSLLVRRAQAENPADAEKHAVRLHKVRGHYADYRRGAGLFGKYKVLIWVEEHEVGDAELGTVVSSYRVQ